MTARHSATPQRNPTARRVVVVGAALIAAVLLVGLAVAGMSRLGIGGLCGGGDDVTVAAEPSIVGHVEALADEAGGCSSYEVSEVSSADMSTRIAGRQELPDIWVPDSTVRLAQASSEVQTPFDIILNSVASTPVVIASRGAGVDMSTWTAALATPGLAMGDPLRSGTADAPILAATSEVETMRSTSGALGTVLAALAQGQAAGQEAPPTERELLDTVVSEGGAAIVSEQQGVRAQRDTPDAGLELAAPATGAVFLSYPLAVTTQDPTRRDDVTEAAEELRDATASDDFAEGLAEDGFRGADRAHLGDGAGVGETEAMVVRDPDRLRSTLQRWRLLSMPTRSLVLMDTSGSMGFTLPGTDRTRIRELVETATAGLGQFPDDSALGLWAFGGAAAADGRPFRELAPIGRLDAPTPDGTTRDSLEGALATLPRLVGGSTDLYQTVLDAYGMVRDSHDPTMVNSIIVVSDGAEDTTSPLTEVGFLDRLRGMVDPARPVVVVTVGLLDDVDTETLGEVSSVTGGSSHIARTPDEIVRVFAEAIQQRGGA